MRIVVTGGPSAGKTTLLEILRLQFGDGIGVAPEAASILFRGGIPRPVTFEDSIHLQRSIYSLQRELELQALERRQGTAPVFCDRGSLDGCAYWTGSAKEFCFAMGTTLEKELDRYAAVIHLQTASEFCGYTNTLVRTESPAEAARLDQRIGEIWSLHPNYMFVGNTNDLGGTFVDKLNTALAGLRPYLPTIATLGSEFQNAQAN